jgi:hypothetical protein
LRKFRNQDKEIAEMQNETRLHDNLGIASEEYLHELEQLLEQDLFFGIEALHRYGEPSVQLTSHNHRFLKKLMMMMLPPPLPPLLIPPEPPPLTSPLTPPLTRYPTAVG